MLRALHTRQFCRMRRQAFSLVELVIVVVIIGIIAAITVPRMSRAANGAGDAALWGNLATLRGAIDMYAAEHGGGYPGTDETESELIDQLTKKTNAAGNMGTTAGVHIYGPYLRRGFPPVPVGPNTGATGVILTATTPLTLAVDEGSASRGWVYNYVNGEIIPNTDDSDDSGTLYTSY